MTHDVGKVKPVGATIFSLPMDVALEKKLLETMSDTWCAPLPRKWWMEVDFGFGNSNIRC